MINETFGGVSKVYARLCELNDRLRRGLVAHGFVIMGAFGEPLDLGDLTPTTTATAARQQQQRQRRLCGHMTAVVISNDDVNDDGTGGDGDGDEGSYDDYQALSALSYRMTMG